MYNDLCASKSLPKEKIITHSIQIKLKSFKVTAYLLILEYVSTNNLSVAIIDSWAFSKKEIITDYILYGMVVSYRMEREIVHTRIRPVCRV